MNFVPVRPPRRQRRRRLRRLTGLVASLLAWGAGTTFVTTVWWRGHPDPNLPDAASITVFYAVAVGGALRQVCHRPESIPTRSQGTRMTGTGSTGRRLPSRGTHPQNAAKRAAETQRRRKAD